MNLKPCPFCGSKKITHHSGSNNYIECDDCGTTGPNSIDPPYSMTQLAIRNAIVQDNWNTRYKEEKGDNL